MESTPISVVVHATSTGPTAKSANHPKEIYYLFHSMKKEVLLELLSMALKNDEAITETLPVEGEKRIVILQRGWIYVGDYYEQGMSCWLENASCIRNWGTTKGLGELAEDGPNSNTTLDPCPIVRFHKMTVVATIDVNKKSWKK